MDAWTIYWITRLDALINAFQGLAFLGFTASAFSVATFIVAKINKAEDLLYLGKLGMKIAIPMLVIGILVFSFIPTTKDAVTIYVLPKIANNEQVQRLPGNMLGLLNAQLENWKKGVNDKTLKMGPGSWVDGCVTESGASYPGTTAAEAEKR